MPGTTRTQEISARSSLSGRPVGRDSVLRSILLGILLAR